MAPLKLLDCPAAAAIVPCFVASLWARVLISGNLPGSASVGTSVIKRIPFILTAILSAFSNAFFRATSHKRDQLICQFIALLNIVVVTTTRHQCVL